jgi:RNA polymerase sigma-70 factor, ECF subfamily
MTTTRQTPALGREAITADSGGQIVPLRRLDARRAASAEVSDEALLAACGLGDAAALGTLYDRHHEAVFRLVSRLLRSEPGEVDDLVQTTFMEAWKSAAKFHGQGAVRSYLYGIAANVVRHHIRGAVRRRNAHAAVPEPARTTSPADNSIRVQQMARLSAALDRLPDDQRAAYVLCELEDVSGVDAARALGVRAGTLGRWLHEARRALREAIEGDAT